MGLAIIPDVLHEYSRRYLEVKQAAIAKGESNRMKTVLATFKNRVQQS